MRKFAKKFSSVRMQLVASVFVAIAPALVLTYILNQDWFWQYSPDWLKQYAAGVPWASFLVGLLALMAAWYGGEHFILRQVRALADAAQRLTKGDWSARTGYHLGSRLARDRDVSAVFVANDQMALGLLRAMHEAGRRIPDELSVVGFDDIPEAPYFTPPLTTVRQDFGEVGSRSLRALVDTIASRADGSPPPAGSLVAPELVLRASTARGRAAAVRPGPAD